MDTGSGIVEFISVVTLALCTEAVLAHISETCDSGSILGLPPVQGLGFSISPSKPEYLQTCAQFHKRRQGVQFHYCCFFG